MAALLFFLLLTGTRAAPQEAVPSAPAPMCPVMTDEPMDPGINVEWEGRRVYFCCKMCRKQFLAEPEVFRAAIPSEAAYAAYFGEDTSTPEEPGTETDTTEPASDAGEDPATEAAPTREPEPIGLHERLSRFHPLVVHFPIALLLVASLAELLRRRDVARFCLGVGTLSAAFAAWLGLAAEDYANYPTLEDVLFRHRWLGIGTALVSIAAWWLSRSADDPKKERLYRVLLFTAAILVAIAGHHGGSLVYGPDWLFG